MPREDYDKLISRMKVCLQVFLSESLCYSFADVAAMGVPSIITESIANNFGLSSYLREKLVVKDIDSPVEISEKIMGIINILSYESYIDLSKRLYEEIGLASKINYVNIKKLLDEIL